MVRTKISTKAVSEKSLKRQWHEVDVSGKVLGRIVPEIVKLLQGKNKVTYVPYLDAGDYVVIVNAKKIKLTGRKLSTKTYTYYSGYPGGLRTVKAGDLLEQNPAEIIKHAVLGMLPKNKLRDRRIARLHIFADGSHPYKDKFSAKS